MSLGSIHNHNGSICKASKIPCPLGATAHSKDLESYFAYHAKESGIDVNLVKSMVANGTPHSHAIAVAKSGLSTVSAPTKKKQTSSSPTPAAIEKFQAYRKQWSDTWAKIYSERGEASPDGFVSLDPAAGELESARIVPQADGGIAIPAGKYVFVTSDGWGVDADFDDEHGEKWATAALYDTPPGAIGGAYLAGAPTFFLTAMDAGNNNGYDGEILVPKATFEQLKSKGYFQEDDGQLIHVKKNTVVYGYLGDPAYAPKGLYDYENYDDISPEADAIYSMEEGAQGSIFSHPDIDASAVIL